MADRTALEPPDAPPYQGLYYPPLSEGQRHGQHFCHDDQEAAGRLTASAEPGDQGGGDNRPVDTCASEEDGRVTSWINASFGNAPPDLGTAGFGGVAGRGGSQDGECPSGWRSPYCHGAYGGGGEQKLDSFSEAFARRNIPLFQNGGRGVIFTSTSGAGTGRTGSLTRVLSDPSVTPGPLLPVPGHPQYTAGQATLSPLLDIPLCPGLQSYYSPAPQVSHSPAPVYQGKCPLQRWTQQSGDQAEDGAASHPQLQDRDSSLIYPGDTEFTLRHPASAHQDDYGIADHCSFQTPLSSPPGQYPQSCASFQPEPSPASSADLATPWFQEGVDRGPDRSGTLPCLPLFPVSMPACPQGDGIGAGEEGGRPYLGSPFAASWPLCASSAQGATPTIYTGLPFSSVLQSGGDPEMPSHYTPAPMLNPLRRGTGLFCRLLPSLRLYSQSGNEGSLWSEERKGVQSFPQVNVGPGFQAELPQLQKNGDHEVWTEEPPWEELLWKPWEELGESAILQEKVEIFLDLCSSSAMPGGGTNLELALHCLSRCQGNILAAVEMLLLSTPLLAGDYHYCGSDIWILNERRLFNKAFATYNKDFSLIHDMVKTKRVSQCVEFYYLSKKIPEQQRKQRERERGQEGEMNGSTTDSCVLPISKPMAKPLVMPGTIPSTSLATSFPCKQCGKMFYKIKSRNAHMKIHRQQPDDWRERDQNPPFPHSLTQNLAQTQARLAFIQGPGNHMGTVSSPGLGSTALPLYASPHSTWDPFDLAADPNALYYDPEGKVMLGVTGGVKGQILWQ